MEEGEKKRIEKILSRKRENEERLKNGEMRRERGCLDRRNK